MIDLINGKTVYCPECGKPFVKYDGNANGESACVRSYCENCNKHYTWLSYIHKVTKEHTIAGFRHYHYVEEKFKR